MNETSLIAQAPISFAKSWLFLDNELIGDAFLSWSVFWIIYCTTSLFFDFKYKTAKHITRDDIVRTVFRNMIYTGIFQPIFFILIPSGILDPQFTLYRLIISVMIAEVIFFYTHKLLHHKSLYRYHEKHHLLIQPCAFAALYCSGLEAVMSNHLSIVVGPIITGMKGYELFFWFGMCALNTLKAHSGSRLDFFNSRYHDLHHSKRVVNFGFLYLLDILHGTCELPQKEKSRMPSI